MFLSVYTILFCAVGEFYGGAVEMLGACALHVCAHGCEEVEEIRDARHCSFFRWPLLRARVVVTYWNDPPAT